MNKASTRKIICPLCFQNKREVIMQEEKVDVFFLQIKFPTTWFWAVGEQIV